MVRLGAMHYCNDAAKFVPDVARPRNLAAAVRSQGLSKEAAAAAANVDLVLENLRANTAETTDYFKVLVAVFSGQLQAAGNEHMREFWAIVPALSLSYVDAMVAAKDKLGKRGKDALGAMFTDEGFALGVAYLLRVLGADKAFDNIHWHASVIKHFSQERRTVQAEAARLGAGASVYALRCAPGRLRFASRRGGALTRGKYAYSSSLPTLPQTSAARRHTLGWAAGCRAATRRARALECGGGASQAAKAHLVMGARL